jgi:hypothetical protein
VSGGIFVRQVVKLGEFPEFDDQTKGLMGLSSVT